MRNYIFILILMLSSIEGKTQNNMKIDSLIVFNYENNIGLTTMGAYSKAAKLNQDSTVKKRIFSDSIKNKFELILNTATCKKHRQRKLGISGLTFIAFYTDNNTKLHLGLINSRAVISDFTTMNDYFVENPDYNKWILDIIKKDVK